MDFSHDTCKMVIFHESFEENPLIKKFFNHRDYIVECKLEPFCYDCCFWSGMIL